MADLSGQRVLQTVRFHGDACIGRDTFPRWNGGLLHLQFADRCQLYQLLSAPLLTLKRAKVKSSFRTVQRQGADWRMVFFNEQIPDSDEFLGGYDGLCQH